MTDLQLYLSIGIPSVVAILGILVNVAYFVSLNGRMGSIEIRLDGRINGLESKIDTKIDLLLGKMFELDSRLARVEEQLRHR